MTRLVLLCLTPLFFAFAAHAQPGILEGLRDQVGAMKAQLDRIELKLAAGSVPPDTPPVVSDPPEVFNPPPNAAPGQSYLINGMGTVRGVALPAVISVRNAMPGARLIWVKQPPVKPGQVRMTEGGKPVDGDGYGPVYNIPMGNHDFLLTPEVAGTVVAVQVR